MRQLEVTQLTPVRSYHDSGFLESMRLAQRQWAGTALRDRLAVITRLRHVLASEARSLAETVPTCLPGALCRTVADTVVSEVLPLIHACLFLSRNAGRLLKARRLGSKGRPAWLGGVSTESERVPLGVVLILGAGNYPLLLAGVQTIQALTAGNAVLWKPAPDTESTALAFRSMLLRCGLPADIFTILDSDVESANLAIHSGVDHVVLTGSVETGRAVLRQLAETLTPATMELSGCDAVFVLPGEDDKESNERLVQALAFGLRFNGSFTCMAPRRVFLVDLSDERATRIEKRLEEVLRQLNPVPLPAKSSELIDSMVADARQKGAKISLLSEGATLITNATPDLLSMQTSVFAPILSVMRTAGIEEALAANATCPYALTASIFGPRQTARALAQRLLVGNVVINDILIPTADPRISFGGRGDSGFGVTRGAEGLLAMTTPRTIQTQRSKAAKSRAWDPTDDRHTDLFTGLTLWLHGKGLGLRLSGLTRMIAAARKMK